MGDQLRKGTMDQSDANLEEWEIIPSIGWVVNMLKNGNLVEVTDCDELRSINSKVWFHQLESATWDSPVYFHRMIPGNDEPHSRWAYAKNPSELPNQPAFVERQVCLNNNEYIDEPTGRYWNGVKEDILEKLKDGTLVLDRQFGRRRLTSTSTETATSAY